MIGKIDGKTVTRQSLPDQLQHPGVPCGRVATSHALGSYAAHVMWHTPGGPRLLHR